MSPSIRACRVILTALGIAGMIAVVTMVRVDAVDEGVTCSLTPADPPSGGTYYINVQTSTCPITTGNECTPVTVFVNWGDGSGSYASQPWANGVTGFSHTYSSQGSYSITAWAQNNLGYTCPDLHDSFSW